MIQPPLPLSPEEHEQILQTIEMFEVIVQASPNDAQSLEILQDSYVRGGRRDDAVAIARTLAEVYVGAGQFDSAIKQYELLLQSDPSNVEVMAALGEAEDKMRNAAAEAMGASGDGIDFEISPAPESSALMATPHTFRPEATPSATSDQLDAIAQALADDGNEALAKFLIQHRIAQEDVVRLALDRVAKKNKDLAVNVMATSLLDEVVRRGGLDLEATLCAIVDRAKFAYIPLEHYDVDRQIVKMLPETLTLGRLMVPFDVMSRTVMIATANPFDAPGKDAAQHLLDYNIQWHIASPTAIIKILGDTYKVAAPGMVGASVPAGGATPINLASGNAAPSPAPAASAPLPDTSGFKLANQSLPS